MFYSNTKKPNKFFNANDISFEYVSVESRRKQGYSYI